MPDTKEETQQKILSLGTLFAVCPSGQSASEAIEVYLRALRNVPVALVMASCEELIETWCAADNYSAPAPADVLKMSRKLRAARRMRERDEEFRHRMIEAKENSLPRGEVIKLLREVASALSPPSNTVSASRLRKAESQSDTRKRQVQRRITQASDAAFERERVKREKAAAKEGQTP
jgi:hypothetical protein